MMCLIDACEAIKAEAIAMELKRIRPEEPCRTCRPGDPCYWHKPKDTHGKQTTPGQSPP